LKNRRDFSLSRNEVFRDVTNTKSDVRGGETLIAQKSLSQRNNVTSRQERNRVVSEKPKVYKNQGRDLRCKDQGKKKYKDLSFGFPDLQSQYPVKSTLIKENVNQPVAKRIDYSLKPSSPSFESFGSFHYPSFEAPLCNLDRNISRQYPNAYVSNGCVYFNEHTTEIKGVNNIVSEPSLPVTKEESSTLGINRSSGKVSSAIPIIDPKTGKAINIQQILSSKTNKPEENKEIIKEEVVVVPEELGIEEDACVKVDVEEEIKEEELLEELEEDVIKEEVNEEELITRNDDEREDFEVVDEIVESNSEEIMDEIFESNSGEIVDEMFESECEAKDISLEKDCIESINVESTIEVAVKRYSRESLLQLKDANGKMSPELKDLHPFIFGKIDLKKRGGKLGKGASENRSSWNRKCAKDEKHYTISLDDKNEWRSSRNTSGTSFNRRGSGKKKRRSRSKTSKRTCLPIIHAENRWLRPQGTANEVETVRRESQKIFNKISEDNYSKMVKLLKEQEMNDLEKMETVIQVVFQKAQLEPSFCSLYAKVCNEIGNNLSVEAKRKDGSTFVVTFRQALLVRCQMEFEGKKLPEKQREKSIEKEESAEDLMRQDKIISMYLGMIKFVGELFLVGLLGESTIHRCFSMLLGQWKSDQPLNDLDLLRLEHFLLLMSTVGSKIDHLKGASVINCYFDALEHIMKRDGLSKKLRFRIMDLKDLRRTGWKCELKK
jgi:hypothetical protein